MAVRVSVTDLGADASPVLVDQIVEEVESELGHLVVDVDETRE